MNSIIHRSEGDLTPLIVDALWPSSDPPFPQGLPLDVSAISQAQQMLVDTSNTYNFYKEGKGGIGFARLRNTPEVRETLWYQQIPIKDVPLYTALVFPARKHVTRWEGISYEYVVSFGPKVGSLRVTRNLIELLGWYLTPGPSQLELF